MSLQLPLLLDTTPAPCPICGRKVRSFEREGEGCLWDRLVGYIHEDDDDHAAQFANALEKAKDLYE